MTQLFLNRDTGRLYDGGQQVFDALSRAWRRVPQAAEGGDEVSLQDAVRWLQRESGRPVRAPVSIVGPRAATDAQLTTAEALGRAVAGIDLALLCGGLVGAMTAAAKGAYEAGGLTIGILPDTDWRDANPYIRLSLATGVGLARNAIIAEAGFCIVAVGGGHGTLSEMAYGKQFGRPVYGLEDAPQVDGVDYLASVDEAVIAICRAALNLDGAEKAWR